MIRMLVSSKEVSGSLRSQSGSLKGRMRPRTWTVPVSSASTGKPMISRLVRRPLSVRAMQRMMKQDLELHGKDAALAKKLLPGLRTKKKFSGPRPAAAEPTTA